MIGPSRLRLVALGLTYAVAVWVVRIRAGQVTIGTRASATTNGTSLTPGDAYREYAEFHRQYGAQTLQVPGAALVILGLLANVVPHMDGLPLPRAMLLFAGASVIWMAAYITRQIDNHLHEITRELSSLEASTERMSGSFPGYFGWCLRLGNSVERRPMRRAAMLWILLVAGGILVGVGTYEMLVWSAVVHEGLFHVVSTTPMS